MKVFKFGGVSIKDPESINRVIKIIREHKPNVVVFSAIGKTTNAFETLVDQYHSGGDFLPTWQQIESAHLSIMEAFFPTIKASESQLNPLFQNLEQRLKKPPFVNYSKTYDQIVPYGELLSTTLMHHILTLSGIENQWHDMTTLLQTDSHYQQAAIDMKTSTQNIRKAVKDKTLNIFQGFIGGNREGFMTTLGREGSDYSAALVASMLKAKEVTVWKDVAGILNADPRYFDKPELLPHLSYDEAVELAYYGAKVIHPKTVRPLRDQHIRLHVRSFLNPQQPGTVIDQHAEPEHHQPCYIMKKNQCLMQCRTRDYTFITEAHLQRLYREFHELNIQVNMIQQAAIAVSVVMDADERRTEELEDRLSKWLDVTFTQGFDLATIRHYTATSIDHVVTNHKVVMQQTNGITAHLLMKQIS